MIVRALGRCHPDCRFCAREWFGWWRRRMAQMHRPRRGETVSFAVAASTSIREEQGMGDDKDPATTKLVAAIEAEAVPSRDDATLGKIWDLAQQARRFDFHDFKSKRYAAPKVELVIRLRACGLDSLALRVVEGDFDEGPIESEAWADTAEGRDAIARSALRRG